MATFHDHWFSAFQELRNALPYMTPMEWHEWRDKLTEARVLIDEENAYADRQRGGQLIRDVRVAARDAKGQAAA